MAIVSVAVPVQGLKDYIRLSLNLLLTDWYLPAIQYQLCSAVGLPY